MVLGGRKIRVRKPRVWSTKGEEVTPPTWEECSDEDSMVRRVLEHVCVGVSTRKYERSLENLLGEMDPVGSKKSSISRRFAAQESRLRQEFLSRNLAHLDLPILMLDGTYLGDQLLLVALGIDAEGNKHVLGFREGGTESYEVCKSLLHELIDRGLEVERLRLFVIDGRRGLRKATCQLFRGWFRIQRCQIHKMCNVLKHLPETRRGWVKTTLQAAFLCESAKKGERRARQLLASLEEDHPGAAGAIQEGLSEMFTVAELGIHGALWRTLRSTNVIENLQGSLQYTSRNVKRCWRSGSMALRWAVTGAIEAEQRFRRVRGYRQVPSLIQSLSEAVEQSHPEKTLLPRKKGSVGLFTPSSFNGQRDNTATPSPER